MFPLHAKLGSTKHALLLPPDPALPPEPAPDAAPVPALFEEPALAPSDGAELEHAASNHTPSSANLARLLARVALSFRSCKSAICSPLARFYKPAHGAIMCTSDACYGQPMPGTTRTLCSMSEPSSASCSH